MYNVSFNGETAGSVAKRELTPQRRYEAPVQLPEQAPDTVSFRGKEEKKESVPLPSPATVPDYPDRKNRMHRHLQARSVPYLLF